jgi:hypothetical protein
MPTENASLMFLFDYFWWGGRGGAGTVRGVYDVRVVSFIIPFVFFFRKAQATFLVSRACSSSMLHGVYNPSGADTSPDTGLPVFLTSPQVILLSYFPPIKKEKSLSSLP